MPGSLRVPVLDPLIPGGLSYGRAYLVEFEPQSLWYDTSLTICAQALKQGKKSIYHTLMHLPTDIRRRIRDQGVDLERAQDAGLFRLTDAYTPTTGLDLPDETRRLRLGSLDISKWNMTEKQQIENPPEEEKGWVHIDDDLSIMLQYNDENEFYKSWRNNNIPWARALDLVVFQPIPTGVHSESFYRRMESLCDGILEFRTRDETGRVENFARARMMRGKAIDSTWKLVGIHDNGEVRVGTSHENESMLGIKGWIKGPRKHA